MAVCVINLPKIQHDVEEKDKMKFKDIFTVIKKNDQLRWAVLLILLYNVAIQAIMGVATYYFSYVCNNAGNVICIYDQCIGCRSSRTSDLSEGNKGVIQKESVPDGMCTPANRVDLITDRWYCMPE